MKGEGLMRDLLTELPHMRMLSDRTASLGSASSIPDMSHQAVEGGKITAFEEGGVAGIGSQVVGLQGVEDFANFLKLLMVRRYGLEGMTGEQIGLGQL